MGSTSRDIDLFGTKKSKIFEIGVNYHGRTYDEGKKIKYDVFSVVFWILYTRLKTFYMKCKICSSSNIHEVIDLGKQPLANKYPKNKKEIIKEKSSI